MLLVVDSLKNLATYSYKTFVRLFLNLRVLFRYFDGEEENNKKDSKYKHYHIYTLFL